MSRALMVLAAVAAIGSVIATPKPAVAGGGDVAAGIVGGLAVGTLLGAAVAQPRYYGPGPVYVEEPVYAMPPRCFWTRGEPVWDGYRGVWMRPRMRVCE
jgi:hypothetical protein